MEAFGDGKVARMDNFRRTEVWRGGKCRKIRAALDKGQKQELEAFIAAVKNGASMPVAFDSLVATTACTLAVGRSIARGQCELVASWERMPEQRTAEEESPYALRAAQ
jgi:hypothetical protein